MSKNGKVGEEVSEVSKEAAVALIEADRRNRTQLAVKEIEAALARHNCRLEAVVVLRAGQVIPQVEIQPND